MSKVTTRSQQEFEYDVCLSFAGEQRSFVQRVANALTKQGIRVFFDDYEKPELWGKNLYEHLDEVYQHLARYCILFASADYAAKVWTNHERRSAQARALKEKGEYILPARFDNTPIPGLPDTVHYIDLTKVSPTKLAAIAKAKIGLFERREYLPPIPNRLFARLKIKSEQDCEQARKQASRFLETLRRMTNEEREVVLKLLTYGCPADLPKNVHINLDLLRRVTGKSAARLKSIAGQLRSLGFTCRTREPDEDDDIDQLGESEALELEWADLSTDLVDEEIYPSTLVAHEMVQGATQDYCDVCGWKALSRLDFSQLSAATAITDTHRGRNRYKPEWAGKLYGKRRH
jgi:hypothetical protein